MTKKEPPAQPLNQEGWIPVGKQNKDMYKSNEPPNNGNAIQTQPGDMSPHHGGPYFPQGVHNASQKRSTNGPNSISSLTAATQRPHWAHVYASRLSPETSEIDVKNDLERNLKKITGKIHIVEVNKLESESTYYSSFHVSCYCVNSEVFMDPTLWPKNSLFRWLSRSRRLNNGGYPTHHS